MLGATRGAGVLPPPPPPHPTTNANAVIKHNEKLRKKRMLTPR